MEMEQKDIKPIETKKIKEVLDNINKFEKNLELLESIWSKESNRYITYTSNQLRS